MVETYPVRLITAEMVLAEEQMGSKDKFWCEFQEGSGTSRWLFKEPRNRTGNAEHLAEKIAQELADLIGVPCARIEFGLFGERRGTVSRNIQNEGEALVHGNEIIAGRVTGYDRFSKGKSRDHTFANIQVGIKAACGGRCEEDLRIFAGYLVLDALIGNTDRHHENWALLRRETGEESRYRLAPSFDHASSLGRELSDDRRLLLLREKRIGAYLEKGTGGIYISEEPISPLELVRRLAGADPVLFRPWLREIEKVTDEVVDRILLAVPEGWITGAQRDFAKALVCESREFLVHLIE